MNVWVVLRREFAMDESTPFRMGERVVDVDVVCAFTHRKQAEKYAEGRGAAFVVVPTPLVEYKYGYEEDE